MSPKEQRALWSAIHLWQTAPTAPAQLQAATEVERKVEQIAAGAVRHVLERVKTPATTK